MQQVYTGILDESLKSIEQVQLAVTALTTKMTDAKRLIIIHSASGNIEQNLTDYDEIIYESDDQETEN